MEIRDRSVRSWRDGCESQDGPIGTSGLCSANYSLGRDMPYKIYFNCHIKWTLNLTL